MKIYSGEFTQKNKNLTLIYDKYIYYCNKYVYFYK